MFRYKIVCFSILILSFVSNPARAEVCVLRPAVNHSLTLGYTTWVEQMNIDDGTSNVKDVAQFIGTSLGFSREKFGTKGSWGHVAEVAALFGQANGGGTQAQIAYQKSHQAWVGGEASLRLAYRLSPSIVFSLGPLVLVKKISWPTETPNLTVNSGASTNTGALADLKFYLSDHWELRQSVATLATRASTLWSLGFGYHF